MEILSASGISTDLANDVSTLEYKNGSKIIAYYETDEADLEPANHVLYDDKCSDVSIIKLMECVEKYVSPKVAEDKAAIAKEIAAVEERRNAVKKEIVDSICSFLDSFK